MSLHARLLLCANKLLTQPDAIQAFVCAQRPNVQALAKNEHRDFEQCSPTVFTNLPEASDCGCVR